MRVYFISGLGADKTVFQLLKLQYCEPVFIDWITPFKNETLPQYALRLKKEKGIEDDAVVLGLSFGGMLATEIAKAFPKVQVIILSSSKTKHEIPASYMAGIYFPMYKWLPDGVQKYFMRSYEKMFGVTSPRGKKIYQALIKNADISFNKWAVWALLHWDNITVPTNLAHVHGTNDKILYYKNVHCDITVPNGGHLMVMEQADEISAILEKLIVKD
jgi:pimeloyl-ACP methyl ester carboxylesterase